MATDHDYTRRAMAAWSRSGGKAKLSNCSGVYETEGRRYLHLWNVNGTLAVYRIDNAGRLKRLKRWPEAPRPVVRGVAGDLPIEETLAAFGIERKPDA